MAEPTTDTANNSIDRRKDVDDEKLSSKFWLGEITAAHKRNSAWAERGGSRARTGRRLRPP